jgi:hypothetical protein
MPTLNRKLIPFALTVDHDITATAGAYALTGWADTMKDVLGASYFAGQIGQTQTFRLCELGMQCSDPVTVTSVYWGFMWQALPQTPPTASTLFSLPGSDKVSFVTCPDVTVWISWGGQTEPKMYLQTNAGTLTVDMIYGLIEVP